MRDEEAIARSPSACARLTPDASSSRSSRNASAARSACPRWLIAFFSSGVSSRRRAARAPAAEMRIVAETVRAARSGDDFPVPAAFGDQRLGIVGVAHQHDHAVVVRAAVAACAQRRDAASGCCAHPALHGRR